MATTDYGVNNALAVKLWAKGLMHEALSKTWVSKFMGKTTNSLLYVKDDLKKSAGDKITYGLRMLLTGDGIAGDGTLEGNEEALTTYDDAIFIDQLRHAVRSGGKMSEQRVPFSVRNESRLGLADWWADRFDTWFFNQMCGYTVQGDTKFTGMNAVVDPGASAVADTDHILYPDGQTSDQDVESASASTGFNLNLIDYAVEKAETISPIIRPIMINGESKYVIFLHPYQVTAMRTSTDTGQWLDIQKAALSGGKISGNPIYTGALGEYNNVIIHKALRVTQGVNSSTGAAISTVRRAVFCGAQAGCISFGREGGTPQRMSWVEELFDYKNQLGVSAGAIGGLKKARFNSKDFGTIVIPTHAVANGQ